MSYVSIFDLSKSNSFSNPEIVFSTSSVTAVSIPSRVEKSFAEEESVSFFVVSSTSESISFWLFTSDLELSEDEYELSVFEDELLPFDYPQAVRDVKVNMASIIAIFFFIFRSSLITVKIHSLYENYNADFHTCQLKI